jgi:3-oxoisoapionate decarboxylase
MSINRREFLTKAALAALAPACLSSRAAEIPVQRSELGIVTYSFGVHQKATKGAKSGLDYNDPLGYLEACHQLGAGGVQFQFSELAREKAAQFRGRAEQWEMRVEAILTLPKDKADLERFERQLICATQCGAKVARTTMLPGSVRRYERYKTFAEFQQASAQSLASLQLAEAAAARHGLRLAVENHKDHLAAEKLEVLKRISSEYVGMCVDVSNNFALCEDLMETARALAPWALTVHVKDHAIEECAEGFRLTDVALGEGFLPLKALVETLQKAKPDISLNLEVITRDGILVPVRSDDYWATFPNRPHSDAEPMMRLAREKGIARPLPLVSQLSATEQLNLEQHNVRQSLAYAREALAL